jgi:hypothetical protein
VLNIRPGDRIYIPSNWPDPMDQANIEPLSPTSLPHGVRTMTPRNVCPIMLYPGMQISVASYGGALWLSTGGNRIGLLSMFARGNPFLEAAIANRPAAVQVGGPLYNKATAVIPCAMPYTKPLEAVYKSAPEAKSVMRPGQRVSWLGEAPNTLGYAGPCTSYNHYSIPGIKPYQYLVQPGDGMNSIAKKFGHPAPTPNPSQGGWGELRDANPQIAVVGLSQQNPGVCVLAINPGDKINIPANWPDPTDWSNIVCADPNTKFDPQSKTCVPIASPPPQTQCSTDSDCPDGQQCVSGKCQPKPSIPPPPQCLSNNDCAMGGLCVAGKCYKCPTDSRIVPGHGCVACPAGMTRDLQDPTRCVKKPVSTAGMFDSGGLLLLGIGAVAAIFMAVKGTAKEPGEVAQEAPALARNPYRRRRASQTYAVGR